jgi:hypothetical protein
LVSNELAKLAKAQAMLGRAKTVGEVRKALVLADALVAAARSAANKDAHIEFGEFRFRAVRRLGEMIRAQKNSGGLSKGGRPAKTGSKSDPVSKPMTLRQVGIDKHLADEARRWSSMPAADFEGLIAEWRKRQQTAAKRVAAGLTQEPKRKGKQSPLFDPEKMYLSWNGHNLELVIEKNDYAPDWLKLAGTSDSMISLISAAMKKVDRLAANLDSPGAVEKLRKEFIALSKDIAKLSEQYWWIRRFLAERDVSSEPERLPDYDAELERRGLWPPNLKGGSDDWPF